MSDDNSAPVEPERDSLRCDCGYMCQGDTVEARIRDGQRHARDAHGIEVSPEQVSAQGTP